MSHWKDIRVVPNDLEIYFKGFEVAFKRRNFDDALRYLKDMKREIDYNSSSLELLKTTSGKKIDIVKETLKPITKVNSKLDRELQEWEVESSERGGGNI